MRHQERVRELVCDTRSLIAPVVVGCVFALLQRSTCASIPKPAPSSRRASAVTKTDLPPVMAAAAAAVDQPPGAITASDGRMYAVVHITAWYEECSGAGGTHYTLQLDEPGNAPRLVHAGGHGGGLSLGLRPLARQVGPSIYIERGYFVAEVALSATPDGAYDAPGWCLTGLPAYAGYALRLQPASGRDDARHQLADIAVRGMALAMLENGAAGVTPGEDGEDAHRAAACSVH